MKISSTFILLAFCFTVCFWQLLIVENGEEAEKKNSSKQGKSSHPVTWKSGLKGFAEWFCSQQASYCICSECNFFFSCYILLFFFHPCFSQDYQYHPSFLWHVRKSSLCWTSWHLCKSNQMFLLEVRALFSQMQAQGQGQSFGVRHPNANLLFNNTMSG